MWKTINIKSDPSFNFRTTNNPTHFCVVYCLFFMHDKRDDSFVIVWFKQVMGDNTGISWKIVQSVVGNMLYM